jgi:hypothetical protein
VGPAPCPTPTASGEQPGGRLQLAEHRPAAPTQVVVRTAGNVLRVGRQLQRRAGRPLCPGPLGGRAEEVGDDQAAARLKLADQPAALRPSPRGKLKDAAFLVGNRRRTASGSTSAIRYATRTSQAVSSEKIPGPQVPMPAVCGQRPTTRRPCALSVLSPASDLPQPGCPVPECPRSAVPGQLQH